MASRGGVVNRFVLPVLLVVDAGLLVAYFVWHASVLRVCAVTGFALLAVLVVVDTLLERRRV